jgi:O-antigen/teichoic acid export membrane protein
MNFRNSSLLKVSISAIFLRIVSAGLAVFSTLTTTRFLGAEQAGLFFTGFAVVTFLSTFSRVGLDNAVLRFISTLSVKETSAARDIFIKSIYVVFITSSLISLLFVWFSKYIAERAFGSPELSDILIAIAPAIVGLALSTVSALALQALHKVSLATIVLGILAWTIFCSVIIVTNINTGLKAAHVFAISTIFTAFIGFILVIQRLPNCSYQNRISFYEVLSTGIPLCIFAVLTQIQLLSGQFFSAFYLTPTEVSYFAAVQKMSVLPSFLMMAVNMVVAQRISKLYHEDNVEGMALLVRKSIRWLLIGSFPMIVIVLGFSQQVMSFFGPEFSSQYGNLRIMVLSQIIVILCGSVSYILSMTGYEKDLRNALLFSTVLSYAMNAVFVPHYGLGGVVWIFSISAVVQTLILVFLVKIRFGFYTVFFWKA